MDDAAANRAAKHASPARRVAGHRERAHQRTAEPDCSFPKYMSELPSIFEPSLNESSEGHAMQPSQLPFFTCLMYHEPERPSTRIISFG